MGSRYNAYSYSASNIKHNLKFQDNINSSIVMNYLRKIYLIIKEIKDVFYFIFHVGLSSKSIISFISHPINTLKNILYAKNQHWVNNLNRNKKIINYSVNFLLDNNKYSEGYKIIHNLLIKYPSGLDN